MICDRCKKEFSITREAIDQYKLYNDNSEELYDYKINVKVRDLQVNEKICSDYTLCPHCYASFVRWTNKYNEYFKAINK